MKYYEGKNYDDKPLNGGQYVDDTGEAEEAYNFYNVDNVCYGFVETKHTKGKNNALHIEKIDPSCSEKDQVDNVRTVFVASSPSLRKTVVVGWYENATVFRNRQFHKIDGKEHQYNLKCNYNDAHLIPEEKRIFGVPSAFAGNKFGMGQANIWYIQKNVDAADFLNELNNYIDGF